MNLRSDIAEACTRGDHVEEQSKPLSIRIAHVCDDFAVQVSSVFNRSRSSFSQSGENENDYENEPDLDPLVAAAAVRIVHVCDFAPILLTTDER